MYTLFFFYYFKLNKYSFLLYKNEICKEYILYLTLIWKRFDIFCHNLLLRENHIKMYKLFQYINF